MSKNKGFTIIELVVVIAIIAILAAIVIVNVSSYIAQAKDAVIKAEMSSLVTMGANYYADHGNYDGFWDYWNGYDDTSGIQPLVDSISSKSPAGGIDWVSCDPDAYCDFDGNTKWCAKVRLNVKVGPNLQFFCVDSSGHKLTGLSTTVYCNAKNPGVCCASNIPGACP
ncbi:MAG: prepilin-type N-terminal cleavage/methylation domain-containing protein [Candidatus Staskawiczbacteria bacterium]|nr:prepilin-type N-terminal cleavage/methylation domain-containing protein [Candidatus Staskawiczbacteria bacterium]